ncbi:hypothetical protein ElyMa_003976200 [Elysia marginata]|uniref:Uncharacterized protein n=1 Tax=Elysia marginata TaxID=1093978 RepID=A0AAV4FY96_9GAST|nr:hypothetical protein ElyMa_003976200 [Elysia marginata]
MENNLSNSDSRVADGTRICPKLTLSRPRVHILARSSRVAFMAATASADQSLASPTSQQSVRSSISTASRNLLSDFRKAASCVTFSQQPKTGNGLSDEGMHSGGIINVDVENSNIGQNKNVDCVSRLEPPISSCKIPKFLSSSSLPRSRKSRPEVLLTDEEIDDVDTISLKCDPNLNALSVRGEAKWDLLQDVHSNIFSAAATDESVQDHQYGAVRGGAKDAIDETDDDDVDDTDEMDGFYGEDSLGLPCPDSGFGQELSDSSSSLLDADMMSLFSDSPGSSSCDSDLSPSAWEETAVEFGDSPLLGDTPDVSVGGFAADFPDSCSSVRTSKLSKSDIPVSPGCNRDLEKISKKRGQFMPVSAKRSKAAPKFCTNSQSAELCASRDSSGARLNRQPGVLEKVLTMVMSPDVSPDSGIDSPTRKRINVVRALFFLCTDLKRQHILIISDQYTTL